MNTIAALITDSPLPRLETELLLAHVLKKPRVFLMTWPEFTVSIDLQAEFDQLLTRRINGEPIAYILGEKEFWSLNFKVTPDTLIPRPETENLVEAVLALLPKHKQRVLELATGSGAIACALKSERADWHITATDISEAALKVAQYNANCHGLNIEFIRSDWILALAPQRFDAIVANPPYIAAVDKHLRQGDLPFEPQNALTSGTTGLEALTQIIEQANSFLNPGGLLALEHGMDQAESVQRLLKAAGFRQIETKSDLAGHPRVTLGFVPY